jgi:hypothetical protein
MTNLMKVKYVFGHIKWGPSKARPYLILLYF